MSCTSSPGAAGLRECWASWAVTLTVDEVPLVRIGRIPYFFGPAATSAGAGQRVRNFRPARASRTGRSLFCRIRARYTQPMQISNIPFGTTDWSQVERTEHGGESGSAYWRTRHFGSIRVRMVEYSPGYVADHWCEKGHILLCLSG